VRRRNALPTMTDSTSAAGGKVDQIHASFDYVHLARPDIVGSHSDHIPTWVDSDGGCAAFRCHRTLGDRMSPLKLPVVGVRTGLMEYGDRVGASGRRRRGIRAAGEPRNLNAGRNGGWLGSGRLRGVRGSGTATTQSDSGDEQESQCKFPFPGNEEGTPTCIRHRWRLRQGCTN
jgi:hypothetical protein